MIVEELNKLTTELKKATLPLGKLIEKNLEDPFFETEHGKDIKAHISDIMMDTFLLNMKMLMVNLENLSLDMKIRMEQKRETPGSPQEKQSP